MLQTAVHFRAASQSAIILCDISSWCNSNNSTYLFFTYLIPHSRMKAATTLTYNSPYDMKERRKIFSGFIFLAFSTASSFYILFALSMVLQAISSCFKAKMCWHFISGRSVMSFLFSHVPYFCCLHVAPIRARHPVNFQHVDWLKFTLTPLFWRGFQGQSVKELSDLNMEHCPPLCIVTMSVKIVRIISV